MSGAIRSGAFRMTVGLVETNFVAFVELAGESWPQTVQQAGAI